MSQIRHYRVLLSCFKNVAAFVSVRDRAVDTLDGQIDRDKSSSRGTVFATYSRISKKIMRKLSLEEADGILVIDVD